MTAYCVVCRGPVAGLTQNRRTIRYYLSAARLIAHSSPLRKKTPDSAYSASSLETT